MEDLSYVTTISGQIPNYEDFAKKQVELIVVIGSVETKYNVDMSNYKWAISKQEFEKKKKELLEKV